MRIDAPALWLLQLLFQVDAQVREGVGHAQQPPLAVARGAAEEGDALHQRVAAGDVRAGGASAAAEPDIGRVG